MQDTAGKIFDATTFADLTRGKVDKIRGLNSGDAVDIDDSILALSFTGFDGETTSDRVKSLIP